MIEELKIIDDILAPSDTLKIRYEGKNPFLVATLVPKLIRDVMKIPGKDLFESDIRWDVSSEPRSFYGQWMGQRTEDRWSKSRIRVIVQGEQHSKEKIGWALIEIKGTVETSYTFSNFLQRSFWWFYNYSFYYKQRRAYIDFSTDNIYKIREEIMSALGINKEEW